MLLRDFDPQPMLVTDAHLPDVAAVPVIDMHNHTQWGEEWHYDRIEDLVNVFDQTGVAAMVDLDGGTGDRLKRHLDKLRGPYPDRFAVYARLDWFRAVEDTDAFGDVLAKEFRSAVAAGAEGLKVWKDVGLRLRDRQGRRVTVNDERLKPLWEAAAELGVPITIHTGDPAAFFLPADRRNERVEELKAHPDWHVFGPEFPGLVQILDEFEGLLESFPAARFVGAHMASCAEDLGRLGRMLHEHENLSVDLSERVAELGRQPYTAREFLITYSNRVLFGLDIAPATALDYRIYYRALETRDEYFPYGDPARDGQGRQGRWRIYGLHLPTDVLARVYHENAVRLLPRLERSVAQMRPKD